MTRNFYGENKVIKNPLKSGLLVMGLENLQAMKDSVTGNAYWRKDVFNSDIGTHVVDTVCSHDTEIWETGVEPKGGKWIIVEQYENRDAAKVGHETWVRDLKQNPKLKLEDIFVNEYNEK